MKDYDIVIVGAGHAGAQAALHLRELGFGGSIALVGGEPHLPYQRPPLSKDYLTGALPFDRLLLRQPAFWQEHAVDLLLGHEVSIVNPLSKTVICGDDLIGYGRMVWAAGGAPRALRCPGAQGLPVLTLRSRADADRLIATARQSSRFLVVGGGYIGLEVAAALIGQGKSVTLLEASERVLSRVAGAYLSRFYEAEHRRRGVDLRTGVQILHLERSEDGIYCATLTDGTRVHADAVIAGIGIEPNVQPLADAGARCSNGVEVDSHCRTSLWDVYAIGDCALHANRHAAGARVRLESIQNATDQARVVARHIHGDPIVYDAVPWVWSLQYDMRLQTVGLAIGYDEAQPTPGPAEGSFSVLYSKGGRLIAADCVNAPAEFARIRRMLSTAAGAAPVG
ncbi:NAD(P)/FAD-dependent oxidoreductase [Cupriavidus lacunae]|uniref:NAD(P)/FAD-dependent oxidoreductase n=1 Tax=Cupriavidus lacunae TaxID=2666307 RepID=A0A370P2F4_9BURK|nr:FAD-dependent oxidoreductase [Cupriavidus lacunae]RDK12041.1 NAD(P)/FAD-dependent oxidoreductase [Cupriavidus lacunae]